MLGTFPLEPLHRLSQQWILALAVSAESFLETSSVRTSTDYISTVLATEYISTNLATEYISTDLPTEYISTNLATEYIS